MRGFRRGSWSPGSSGTRSVKMVGSGKMGSSFHEVAEGFRLWAINAHDQLEEQYGFFSMGWGVVPTPDQLASAGAPASPEDAARMVDFFDQYAELIGQVAESAGRLQARLRENSEQMAALYQ